MLFLSKAQIEQILYQMKNIANKVFSSKISEGEKWTHIIIFNTVQE